MAGLFGGMFGGPQMAPTPQPGTGAATTAPPPASPVPAAAEPPKVDAAPPGLPLLQGGSEDITKASSGGKTEGGPTAEEVMKQMKKNKGKTASILGNYLYNVG